MMGRQWSYFAIEVDFKSPIDNGINKCNAKQRGRVALSSANPRHIHWPLSCLN